MADKMEKPSKPLETPVVNEDKSKRACKKPTPSTPATGSKKSEEINETILAFMKNVQLTLKKNDDRLTGICNRLDEFDKAINYEDFCGEDGEFYEEPSCDVMPSDVVQGEKRKAAENSRFSNMTKKFKTVEVCDQNIDETLAENTNELFKNGIDETRYEELVKDERNARPENCDGLVTVKTNHLI
ncbi:hypothetical protein DPMN_010550 [Dreissena polymorpha]|uniref:Uncharacterized protein n=1 Tax=Dreissena polymorpha TaxID=45954 RepID=A0A9D4N3E6_DREPO|nr:hypothetical protein DPMN_010550 [Dreissena polymorpha]